jgi:hypothetical protein
MASSVGTVAEAPLSGVARALQELLDLEGLMRRKPGAVSTHRKVQEVTAQLMLEVDANPDPPPLPGALVEGLARLLSSEVRIAAQAGARAAFWLMGTDANLHVKHMERPPYARQVRPRRDSGARSRSMHNENPSSHCLQGSDLVLTWCSEETLPPLPRHVSRCRRLYLARPLAGPFPSLVCSEH